MEVPPPVTFETTPARAADTRVASKGSSALGEVLLLAMVAGILALIWNSPANHDTSWLLYATGEWLHGARLYSDIIELNPPFVFILHAPGVGLARLFGISPAQGFYLTVMTSLFISVAWCRRLLLDRITHPAADMFLVAGCVSALVFPFLTGFGQREHLMAIFVLPYVIAHLTSEVPDTGRGAILRAAFATLGILIKPYFVVIPLFLTLGRIAATRRCSSALSHANLTFLAAGLGYVGATALLLPEYLSVIVPTGEAVYGAYRMPTDIIITVGRFWLLLPALAVVVVTARQNVPFKTYYAVLAILAGLAIYVLQWNGFAYHIQPMFAFLLVYYTCLAATASSFRIALLAALTYAFTAVVTFRVEPYTYRTTEVFAPYLSSTGKPKSLIAVSANIDPFFPLVDRFGTRWIGRFPVQWFVPGALAGLQRSDCAVDPEACARFRGIIAEATTITAEDIARHMPDVVVFDSASWFLPDRHYDLQTLFLADPAFAAAMSGYDLAATEGRYSFWRRRS
jgi:hypothetical protein